MKNAFFLIIGIAFIAWCFYTFLEKPAPARYQPYQVLKIGETEIKVEVADTEAEREKGLSGRVALAKGEGLLFVFEIPGEYGFWMKEMNFPIDIIWIDEGWKIVGIQTLINPNTYPQIFYPPTLVKYVLEVPAGYSRAQSIDTGSRVYLGTEK